MIGLTTFQRVALSQIIGNQPVKTTATMRVASKILDALEMSESEKTSVGWRESAGVASWENSVLEFEVFLTEPQEKMIAAWIKDHEWPPNSWSVKGVRDQILSLYDKFSVE